jgi:secreted trypsin-like serine protease
MQDAIRYAEEKAGDDDAAFVRLLNERMARTRAGSGQRAVSARTHTGTGQKRVIPLVPVNAAAKSFRIFEDPRYLANARALARRTRGGFRVIGGQAVPRGEFLDCVAVGSDQQWGCTGTLIAPDVVVTAGHCASFATRIFIGRDVLQAGKIVSVRKRIRHPQYHRSKHHDLMVLLLDEKVTGVKPRRFADARLIDAATDGRVVGFGATDPTGTFGYGTKLFVDVPIASRDCRGKVEGEHDSVTYGCDVGLEIVAGRPLLERDSCKGDSGGPFYVLKGNSWFLAGATSRATDSAMHECGDGGVYVRMDKYRKWIESIPGVALP